MSEHVSPGLPVRSSRLRGGLLAYWPWLLLVGVSVCCGYGLARWAAHGATPDLEVVLGQMERWSVANPSIVMRGATEVEGQVTSKQVMVSASVDGARQIVTSNVMTAKKLTWFTSWSDGGDVYAYFPLTRRKIVVATAKDLAELKDHANEVGRQLLGRQVLRSSTVERTAGGYRLFATVATSTLKGVSFVDPSSAAFDLVLSVTAEGAPAQAELLGADNDFRTKLTFESVNSSDAQRALAAIRQKIPVDLGPDRDMGFQEALAAEQRAAANIVSL